MTEPPPDCGATLQASLHQHFVENGLGCSAHCDLECDPGFSDCNKLQIDGCETSGECPGSDAAIDAAAMCSPSTFDAAAIVWTPPTQPTSACTSADLSDFYDVCFGTNASSQACNAWATNNVECNACLFGSDPVLGVIVISDSGAVYTTNIGGCIALVSGDTSSTGCGAAYSNAASCENLACECPFTDQQSIADYSNCIAAADTSVCASYVGAECNLSPDSGADASVAYDTCLSETTFEDSVKTIGALFCTAGADAGTD